MLNERILADNEKVYPGVKYVLDGVPTINEFPGTVKRLKLIYEVKEVRYYDRAGRADEAGLAQTENTGPKMRARRQWKSVTKG